MVALTFDRVDFGYRSELLLRNLSFSIDDGELAGVLGPNGTGKTTLIRLASGVLTPRSGHVRLGDRDVGELAPRERALQIAVVPQETHSAFSFNVGEIVAMGRAPHQGALGLLSATDREAIDAAMELTDVTALRDRAIRQLSGGERQRVIVARALAQQPKLLLLDEPTAFLDLKHRIETYALLERLNRERNLTILLVSHDINMAARFCRRLVLLGSEGLAGDGTPAEVLQPDIIRRVYGVDNEVRQDPLTQRPYVVAFDRSSRSME